MTDYKLYAPLVAVMIGLPSVSLAATKLPEKDIAVIRTLLQTVGEAHLDLPTGYPFSLQQAFTEVYQNNPQIRAARASLRATDEARPQAEAGYRPSLTGEGTYEARDENGDVTDSDGNQKTLSLTLTQPVFSGGSTIADVRAAESRIKAQRASLRNVEQQTLLKTAGVYLDVVRDQEIAMLTVNNETALATQLRVAEERFNLGDLTLTDIQQSENRLADAVASRLAAQASLKKSKAAFESAVWIIPSNVSMPDEVTGLPASLEEAEAAAEQANPNNAFSKYAIDEAHASTRSLMGTKLPQAEISGQVSRLYGPLDFPDDRLDTKALIFRVTVPFYSGGRTDSLIRQSRQTESQRRVERYQTGRTVRQSVVEAWENLRSAETQSAARKIQIDAARTARDGVKAEADYGTRTTLDVLDAEREYLNAQVNYAGTEHDRVLAAYQLLAAMGRLTPETLGLKVSAYKPEQHYDGVKNAWFGTHVDMETP